MKIVIYSRKSKFTGKGESIDNQIEMCKKYAENHFENIEKFYIYEDEGFSGGNVNRPEFQRLIQDARDKKFNVLICYRLDRISRDVADFSNTIEELNDYNIDFVSIKEQFDTSTPMGRAMMYVTSVFAQLERETIAERVKDNMLQLAMTGRWLGGNTPLGFESEKTVYLDKDYKERSLVILNPIEEEMKLVNFFYDKYLELGSIHQLRKYLIQNNYKTRNDAYYSSRAISDILRNPAYVKANDKVLNYLEDKGISVAGKDKVNNKKGILIYNKKNKKGLKNNFDEWIAAVAKHDGVISPNKWLEVQYKLDKNSMQLPRESTSKVGLLSGIIKCSKCGHAMNIMYGAKRKNGTKAHYYTCRMKTISGQTKCNNKNVNGPDIENTVINKILKLAESKDTLLEELEALKNNNNTSTNANLLSELKNKKEQLLEEIDNLVSEVSKSAIASKYILPQIEAKDKEVKNLEKEIYKLESDKDKKNKEAENYNFVVNNIIDFSKMVDTLDNEQKKYFIQTIVDKVYWDGEKEEVAIKLFTGNTELSKFHTTSSCKRYDTGIVLYEQLNNSYRYENYPERTLGEKIRKQRNIKGLTAEELGTLCSISKNTVYSYESNTAIPRPEIMKKIINVLNVDVKYFEDDYYSFVLSENYCEYLKEWRKLLKVEELEEILNISYITYLNWEKGSMMSRNTFDKIRDKLF